MTLARNVSEACPRPPPASGSKIRLLSFFERDIQPSQMNGKKQDSHYWCARKEKCVKCICYDTLEIFTPHPTLPSHSRVYSPIDILILPHLFGKHSGESSPHRYFSHFSQLAFYNQNLYQKSVVLSHTSAMPIIRSTQTCTPCA